MSGGRWNYQQYQIGEEAERVAKFLKAVAESERIVDWAESGDDVRHDPEDGSGAERDLYDLWLKTFNEVYGGDADGPPQECPHPAGHLAPLGVDGGGHRTFRCLVCKETYVPR